VTPIRREATDAERAVIAWRGQRRNATKLAGTASQRGDSVILIVIAVLLLGLAFVVRSDKLAVVR
jgi:hypothetical protein